jgi:hypothetical protein
MSYWTRATVKFWVKGELNINEIQMLVGFASDYYDAHITQPWEKKEHFLPLGSEGTLQIYVHKTTKKQTVFTVSGNLRDVWDVEPITKWFDEVTHRTIKGYWGGKRYICKAQGVAGRDNEGNEVILQYKYKPRNKM